MKLRPPYGPHIGKEATIVQIPDVLGSEAWYIVKLDDGTELLGPESQLEDAEKQLLEKKPIAADKVESSKESERQNLCFLYNNVERPLSLAIQPGTTPENILKLVIDARDKLRIAMRKMGYQGQF